jgi:coenzyme PQQ synthesis protein D (PqqD)
VFDNPNNDKWIEGQLGPERTDSGKPPRARREALVVQHLPSELLVYDLNHHRAHCLNQTAALIWKSCDGHRTPKEIAAVVSQKIGEAVDESVVQHGLDQLERARLLASSKPGTRAKVSLSRREAVRQLGLAALIAPLITSIVAPRALAAASCQQAGRPCIKPRDCCSGICNGSRCG